MAGLGPRVLQVLEFANARAPELQALHEIAQHDVVSSCTDAKLEAQKTQRRRRANAFKSHMMPQRLRAMPKRNRTSLRCRKHERRPHKLLRARTETPESERPRWLSTHLWHAKRMAMGEQHGYILALHRADKSVSAALQAVRKMATLHDASYYGVLELFGLPQVILEALQLVSDPNGSDFHGLRFLAGTEEGSSMLYHEGQFPQGAIAPVTFMWRPLRQDYEAGEFKLQDDWQSTKRQLWLWVHPAAYMEAAMAVAAACQEVVGEDEDGIELHDRRGQLCRLKLRGRLADDLMVSLVGGQVEVGAEEQEIQEDDASDHEDGYNLNETVAKCCDDNRRNVLHALSKSSKKKYADMIFSLVMKDPRLARYQEGKLNYFCTRPEMKFSLLKEPPTGSIPQVGTSVITSPLSGLSLSSLGQEAEEPESKMILKEMQALLAWTTSGSNVTEEVDSASSLVIVVDKGRTELETEDYGALEIKTSPSSLLWSLTKRRRLENNFLKDHKLNEEVYRQRKDSIFVNGGDGVCAKSLAPALHLLAIKTCAPYPHSSGWDLICPPANAPGLLKALVFGGSLVIGLEEDSALSTVLHQPSFPCDYPDTQAGQTYWELRARDLETEQAKKPKSKRFNYEKHGVKSPFQPRWDLLFDGEKPARETEEEDTQALCVLRGDKYMEPFCFYRSSSTTTEDNEDNEDVVSPERNVKSIVPVPMPTLVRVVVVVPRRGNVDVNGMLFAPSAEDVQRYRQDKNWKGDDVGLGKKNKAGNSETDERSLIGYVTSAIYDRPMGAFRAVGFIACEPLQQLFLASHDQKYGKQGQSVLAMLRSPRGRIVRPVLVQAEI